MSRNLCLPHRQKWGQVFQACLFFTFLLGMTLLCSSSEHDEGSDEESAVQIPIDGSHDMVRNGMRLRLSYDRTKDSFTGTVENTTAANLECVRVEVHLSNETELGPTPSMGLTAGETKDIALTADGNVFSTWSAHPEVGCGGDGDEHGGEDDDS